MAVEQITYKNIDPKVRNTIMFGLVLAMLCACFDGTIVGACGPTIAQELKGPGLYTWMITAYLLFECIMIPIAGKLSDLYGRKVFFLVGLFIFVGGSFVAGLSTSMEMLVVCRAIQGLGGGILIPVATAAVADLYAPEARAKMQGVLGAVFGVGSGIGPLLGGWIAENIDWRWCFYINVPIAIVSFILTLKKFPMPILTSKPKIDYPGICLLTVGLAALILIFEFGGVEFEWVSMEIAALVVVTLVAFALFAMVERKAVEPILAPSILRNRTVMAGAIFMLLFGIGMIGAMTFTSYFGIYVLFDGRPLTASYYSLFMIVGMIIGTTISGRYCERTGYRPWIIVGPIIAFGAMYLLSTMSIDGVVLNASKHIGYEVLGNPLNTYIISLLVLGFGLGLMMTPIMAAVQNSSPENQIGMNTSAVNLLRSIGSALGTALFTMMINARYAGLVEGIPGVSGKATEFLSETFYYYLATAPEVANRIMSAFVDSVDFGFLVGGLILLLGVVVGFFIKAKTTTQLAMEKAAYYEASEGDSSSSAGKEQ